MCDRSPPHCGHCSCGICPHKVTPYGFVSRGTQGSGSVGGAAWGVWERKRAGLSGSECCCGLAVSRGSIFAVDGGSFGMVNRLLRQETRTSILHGKGHYGSVTFYPCAKNFLGFQCSYGRCAENGFACMLFLLLNFISVFEHNYVWNLVWKNTLYLFWTLKIFLWIWKYLQCIWFLFAFSSSRSHNYIYCCCLFSPRNTKENCGFLPHKVPCPHNLLKLAIH